MTQTFNFEIKVCTPGVFTIWHTIFAHFLSVATDHITQPQTVGWQPVISLL